MGILLVSWSDSASAKQGGPASRPTSTQVTAHAPRPALGDRLALISALFYALYVILLKVRIKNEERIDMQLFFGFVGLFNIFLCWPIGFILHWTGIEPFELPTKAAEWYTIIIDVRLIVLLME